MLILLFNIKDVTYAIDCKRVREITPMVKLKEIPHTPEYFAGYFNYRGNITPVVDLCNLITGIHCEMRLSTRIIIVDYATLPGTKRNTPNLVGLIAERVTETVKKPMNALIPPSIHSETAPYLGGIIMDDKKMIQYIDLDLLPEGVHFSNYADNGIEDVPSAN